MIKLPYIHEINTFWRAISIHRWKIVLLLQQCNLTSAATASHVSTSVSDFYGPADVLSTEFTQ